MAVKRTKRKKQARKSPSGQYYVTTVITMRSQRLTHREATKLKAGIKRKSPKARTSITKA